MSPFRAFALLVAGCAALRLAGQSATAPTDKTPAPDLPAPLNPEALVAEALPQHPELRFYEASLAAARAAARRAGRLPHPEVSGDVGRIRSNNLD
ncbi:MAG: hypothetical protein ACKOET_20950, partial [Verrucomicrobiota bacterium]